MQDGVRRSEAFVCILSEGYFESEYCCKEMRWAFEYKKPIVSAYKSGVNVGAILKTAPDDFRDRIMAIDSIKLDSSDPAYFKVGLEKIKRWAVGGGWGENLGKLRLGGVGVVRQGKKETLSVGRRVGLHGVALGHLEPER